MINNNHETPKVPKGYKQTEVGIIPEDWFFSQIGSLLTIKHGKSQKDVEDENGNYPILGTGGVIGTAKSYLYNQPSVLIGRKGTINRPVYMETPFWTVDTLFYSHINENNNAKFLYYKFSMIDWMQYNEASGVPSLNSGTIEKIIISYPQLKEQTAIANALSDVDTLIAELEKLITKKEAIKTGAMQQLLTGRTRLPQFVKREDGTLKGYKTSELGQIPEDWEVVELGKLLKYEQPTKYIVKSEILSEGVLPVLTAGKSFILGYTNEKNDVYLQLPVIIFDDFTTDSKYVDFPFKVKSSAMKMLKRIDLMTSNYFLYLVLKNIFFQVGDHKRHWISDFQRLLVGIPKDIEERNLIAEILLDMDFEIEVLEKRLDKTKSLKQGMMQELLTGRTRLV